MPRSAKIPCRQSGCAALVDKSGYCDQHKRDNWKEGRNGNTTQRGYGASWRNLRSVVIHRDRGLCQVCLVVGRVTEFFAVDHKIPKSKGGGDDISNLQCICDPCHKIKTATQDSK